MKRPILSVGDYLFATGMDSYYHYIVTGVGPSNYLMKLNNTEVAFGIEGVDLVIRDGHWTYKSKKKIDFDKELEKL